MKAPAQYQMGQRPSRVLQKGLAVAIVSTLYLALAQPARAAALGSGVYQTSPGATVLEWGDRVPNGSRIVPLFATLKFDLNSGTPSLTAYIPNAVLEGGAPFALTLHSLSGVQLTNGTYRFEGDYLREIYASESQYAFDYQFSASTNGEVLWNGGDFWTGGHLWYVMISNITLIPVPWLDITRAGPASVRISWSTNFASHALETSTHLPAADWGAVTNAPAGAADRISVTLEVDASTRFYRLHKR